MTRGNISYDNISNLHTYMLLKKNNEILGEYINSLQNKKTKALNPNFETSPIDILYISLQLMGNKNKITTEDINKIDIKELTYYLDKIDISKTIKKEFKQLSVFINYLINSLTRGNYTIGINNDIKLANGISLKIDWLVDFCTFLNTSLHYNKYLINGGLVYSIKMCEYPECSINQLKEFIKLSKLYTYNIKRKDGKNISLNDLKYLNNLFYNITEYNFDKMKEINSKLSKEKYILSIDKTKLVINPKIRSLLKKYSEEHGLTKEVINIIEDSNNIFNAKKAIDRQKKNEIYEIIRVLAHAYKNQVSSLECRKLIEQRNYQLLYNAHTIADFYIHYIYDSNNLDLSFDYEKLYLGNIKPSIIDYETLEYKELINLLAKINRNVIIENRKINHFLEINKNLPKEERITNKNNHFLALSCLKLENYSKQIESARLKLSDVKKNNLSKNNINYSKINYIRKAIYEDKISFNQETISLSCLNDKNLQQNFYLELTYDFFNEVILSIKNQEKRLDFYTI